MPKPSLPDDGNPDMELRAPTDEIPCDMAIALPSARAGIPRATPDGPSSAEGHAFGGYTGIWPS